MERNGVIVVATRNRGQEENSRFLALLSLAYAVRVKLGGGGHMNSHRDSAQG